MEMTSDRTDCDEQNYQHRKTKVID